MIYQISLTSQVKQCAIITSKHGVASRVAERLKTRILGNKEISGKCLNSIE